MSAFAPALAETPARPTGLPLNYVRTWAIALVVFASGFVFIEPAPFDLILSLVMGVSFVCGLAIPRAIGPLVVLLVTFVAGGVFAISQSSVLDDEILYTAISLFLAACAIFFACVVAADPENTMETIVNAWIAAACGTTLLGFIGYFGLAGDGTFTLYGRASGGFSDPNVFAPFLIFPLLTLVRRILVRPAKQALGSALLAMWLLCGIFLSFSRGGWGMAALTCAAMFGLLFINERRTGARAKYIAIAVCGFGFCLVMALAAISVDSIGSLFFERAHVVQFYDDAQTGRFARHAAGFSLMMEHPLGLGALEFGPRFGGDEHNIWLKALTTNGWLGFVAYLILTVWTLVAAFPLLFRTSPFQDYAQIAFVTLVGHIALAMVIDIDHWRHVYILFGILWGLIAADRARTQSRLAGRYLPG